MRPASRIARAGRVEAVPAICGIRSRSTRAVQGCGLVFHVAADYRLWAQDPDELYRSNVDGTRNLLDGRERAGVERVVYTSTVGCIGMSRKTGSATRTTPVALEDMTGAYKRSKFLAEQVALEFAARGFPVVIVNPTAPVGDHDLKPTPTGKIVVDFSEGAMPAFIDTGLNVVDVQDIAEAICWRASGAARGALHPGLREPDAGGRSSERWRGSPGRRRRQFETAVRRCAMSAGCISTAWARMTRAEPRAPLDGVRMAKKKMWVSHEKASANWDFSPGRQKTR